MMNTPNKVCLYAILSPSVYLLHAGEPLLTVQSGGRRHLHAAEGVQSERVQKQVFCGTLEPVAVPLFVQHSVRVRVGASGGHRDGSGRTGRAWRPGGGTGTVLGGKDTSVGCSAL